MRKRRKYSNLKTQKTRKLLVYSLASLALLIIGGASFAVWHQHHNKTATVNPTAASASGTRPTNSIDYSPATPSDNTATNQSKGSTPQSSTPPSNSSGSLSITITEANASNGGIEVSALVQGVTSGTCTFNFSRSDGGAVEKNYTEAVKLSANYYACPRYYVPMPEPGAWYVSAVLSSGSQTSSSKWAANPVNL